VTIVGVGDGAGAAHMSQQPSPFAGEFLAGSGAAVYREAIALAAGSAAAALERPDSPGLVHGYAALKGSADSFRLDTVTGVGLPAALDEAVSLLAGNSAVVTHPAYLAHLHCAPTVSSLAAEVLISAFNQSLDSFDQAPAATAIEQQVIEYLCARIGYDSGADGTFTSGGTQSNLHGLLMARDLFAHRTLDWDIGALGLPPEARSWRLLCTRQAHFSARQALRILGLGAHAIVEVPTDTSGSMRADALADCISETKRAGLLPFGLFLTAGTTDYGAIDPLAQAIAIAHEHDIWTHVDACVGGCLAFSDTRRHLLRGIELADSVAIDFHKLLFQAISCSALLVRRSGSFNVVNDHADYLNPAGDADHDVLNLVGKSLQTTRRFDALKVFLTLRALGQQRIAAMIDASCAAAEAAARAVADYPGLVLSAPVTTNTVVVRWHHHALTEDECDDVNNTIRADLAASGRAIVGRSRAAGHQSIKLTFVNPLVTAALAAEVIADIADRGERIFRRRKRRRGQAETRAGDDAGHVVSRGGAAQQTRAGDDAGHVVSRGGAAHELHAGDDVGRLRAMRTKREQRTCSPELMCVERVRASDARFRWAKNVEYTIFGAENNFASESDVAAGEMVHYRTWERASEIFVSFPAESPEPAAVLRALRYDPELGLDSFSTLRDGRNYLVADGTSRDFIYPRWSAFFDDVAPERIAELATQGVRKKFRRAGMIEQIWHAFFGSLATEGVEFVTAALVVPLFEWYRLLLPERIHQIGEILPNYIGADSVPVVIDIGGSFVTDMVRTAGGKPGSLLAATAGLSLPLSEEERTG
jgi:L-2,4-diaminobutyrate decarboxylase